MRKNNAKLIELSFINSSNKILAENNVFNQIIGTIQKEYFEVIGELKIKTNELYKANNTWYNNY